MGRGRRPRFCNVATQIEPRSSRVAEVAAHRPRFVCAAKDCALQSTIFRHQDSQQSSGESAVEARPAVLELRDSSPGPGHRDLAQRGRRRAARPRSLFPAPECHFMPQGWHPNESLPMRSALGSSAALPLLLALGSSAALQLRRPTFPTTASRSTGPAYVECNLGLLQLHAASTAVVGRLSAAVHFSSR